MPLTVLLPMVVIGIGALVLLVHLLGWTKNPSYPTADAARAAFSAEFPDTASGDIMLADDGHSALLDCGDRIGFVASFGQGRLARLLGPGDLAGVREGATGLTLTTHDFTAPRLDIALGDADQRARWRARLAGVAEPNPLQTET